MTVEQKALIRDALMGQYSLERATPEDVILCDKAVEDNITALEPILDAMLDAARQGSNPMDWTKAAPKFDFIPDGDTVLVDIELGVRKFSVSMSRPVMLELGKILIKESARYR